MQATRVRSQKRPRTSSERGDKDDFLEIASLIIHDLGGPLASMKTILRLLEKNRFDPRNELHRRLINGTRVALDRSESIVGDILTVARMEEMKIPVESTRLDLIPILKRSVLMASVLAVENDINIRFDESVESCMSIADANLVPRIIENLLFNAIRHTPSNGIIEVEIEQHREQIHISVTDSGPGLGDIDPETLFTKYKQAKLRNEGKHRGVGLGLYFCRLATKAMNGRIWAETATGGGTCFAFAVPAGGNTDEL
jgi:signal transduction histidine kinase